MNAEWIIGGVAVLIFAVMLKKAQAKGGLQSLITAFIFVWSTLVAMHAWGFSLELVEQFPLPDLTDGQISLVAFWFGFIVALLPSALLLRYWLKEYRTTFPPLADSLLQWLAGAVSAVTLCALLTMSAVPFFPPPSDTPAGKAFVVVRWLPARAYLEVAALFPLAIDPETRRERLVENTKRLFKN
ncbi:MAG: hypothetical protein HN742_38620 [Lentisphaerae bacterium]|jgi:hypothetical protein|nr:hypothetical protein [Lentisphaerota bacterium]MBT4822074.1 hypothetical protein [Lentisphaerota bacterium]MBT5610661.1 hypothetical protein [Lentisphaerota bacterium]MBT7059460.1 hypothetical protein [Lentisphaerota bacterium]MBT7847844.1 hypothetical protein [Lentisphaerota bacterium]